MAKDSKKKEQVQKEKTAVKNFSFNRFLMLRYLLMVFFFTNLYWFLALFISKKTAAWLPFVLLLTSLKAIIEHVVLYGKDAKGVTSKHLQGNKFYHQIQILVNIILMVIVATNKGYLYFFPFLTELTQTRILMVIILFIGFVLSFVCLRRIQAIHHQTDKYFQYIKEFEKTINYESE